MKSFFRLFLFLISIFAILSCEIKNEKTEQKSNTLPPFKELPNLYAKRFVLKKSNDLYRLSILNGKNDTLFRYLFYPKSAAKPVEEKNIILLSYPCEKIAVMSGKYAAYLDVLQKTESVKYYAGLQYTYNPVWRERVQAGKAEEIFATGEADFEKLLMADADVFLDYLPNGNAPVLEKMLKSRLPVLIASEYLEEHPLGQTEWIKVFGLLTGKFTEAEKFFEETKTRYLAEKVQNLPENAPKVFCNLPYGDAWFVPQKDNFSAVFIRDAGGKYLWDDLPGAGSSPLSLEAVYEKAENADFWLNAADFQTLEQVKSMNNLSGKFSAFRRGEVYAYTKRKQKNGGCDYFESGTLRPDLVLADLKKIFNKNPESDLFYYQKLK